MEEEQRNEREEACNLDSEGWGRYSEAELDVLLKKKPKNRRIAKENEGTGREFKWRDLQSVLFLFLWMYILVLQTYSSLILRIETLEEIHFKSSFCLFLLFSCFWRQTSMFFSDGRSGRCREWECSSCRGIVNHSVGLEWISVRKGGEDGFDRKSMFRRAGNGNTFYIGYRKKAEDEGKTKFLDARVQSSGAVRLDECEQMQFSVDQHVSTTPFLFIVHAECVDFRVVSELWTPQRISTLNSSAPILSCSPPLPLQPCPSISPLQGICLQSAIPKALCLCSPHTTCLCR